ncbi:MAG: SusD/RagB family nutrient-binding outer membrane lipoprotein [Leadbetterella sp.]|nr:SusD/RagB family nutrient-binding outer membrane lipoprotein [Leadbetterella sp.]
MKKAYIVVLSLVALYLTSCRDLTEINNNPNNATTTHPQALLTKVEWDAFHSFRGTGPLYIQKMLVQTDGENAGQIYNWQRGDFSAYSNLRNVTKMIEEAEKINEGTYVALGKFFRAYYFYSLALQFGDIPYSEALRGEQSEIFSPKYDAQKDVFKGILAELKEASELLEANPAIISGDIIYNGNSSSWVKAINAFRLKVLMTLSKHENDGELNIKSEFASIVNSKPLFTSISGDDAQLVFLNQEGNRYPEFNSSGYGSGMYMDSTFIRRLQDRNDPRLFVIATQTRLGKEEGKALDDFSSYEGGDPAAPYARVNDKAVAGKLSKVLERYTQDPTTEPLVLISYAEQQFILAEAIIRGWITGNAETAYENGIRSGFKFYENYAKGIGGFTGEDKVAAYLQQPIIKLSAVSSPTEKLERIMMQKYLRSFHQGGLSSYTDNLRTGYPEFRKSAGVNIPYRWMYPQAEYNTNGANVSEAIQRQFSGSDNVHSKTWWLQ